MKWSEKFATGIAAIDDQHRMLFKLADDYRAALDEGRGGEVYGDLLHSLELYARTHFGFEEECMARFVCPAALINKEAHGRFTAFLNRYIQRFNEVGFVRTDARDLVDTVEIWLANHIARVDVRLREVVPTP